MAPSFWVVMCPAIIWGFVTKEEEEQVEEGEQLAVSASVMTF